MYYIREGKKVGKKKMKVKKKLIERKRQKKKRNERKGKAGKKKESRKGERNVLTAEDGFESGSILSVLFFYSPSITLV